MLRELSFYDELSIVKIPETFKKYSRSCKVEIIDSEHPLAQLETLSLVNQASMICLKTY